MYSPGTPGQKSNGRNAARVVAVDAVTGVNIRRAASAYPRSPDAPTSMRRSASSVTIMAPSINMPSAIPNITIKLNEWPNSHKKMSAKRNETGIESATMTLLRKPIEGRTTASTRKSAVTMFPSNSVTCCMSNAEASRVMNNSMFSGILGWISSMTCRIALVVSIELAPTCR